MILEIVNSTYGRPSNIAFRTSKIVTVLKERNAMYEVWCRKSDLADPYVRSIVPGGDFLPRLMNAARMYAFKNFQSRLYDNRMFATFAKSALRHRPARDVQLVHLWDPIPELVKHFRVKNIPVLLEVPIAPAFYGRSLCEKGLSTGTGLPHPAVEKNENESFELADHILVPSDFVKELLVKRGIAPTRISVLPFGSDPIAMNIQYPDDGPIAFGFAGTVNVRKGISYLLEAWADPAFEKDSLHLCGHVSSEFRGKLSQPNIQTPGFVRSVDYLKQCHVYVFPSLMEGSSKSIYEAMSLGMPVITTEAAGSLIAHGVEGLIVPPGRPDKLKEAMLYFKANPEAIREMGTAAKKKVSEYPWSRYGESVVDLYSRLIRPL